MGNKSRFVPGGGKWRKGHGRQGVRDRAPSGAVGRTTWGGLIAPSGVPRSGPYTVIWPGSYGTLVRR